MKAVGVFPRSRQIKLVRQARPTMTTPTEVEGCVPGDMLNAQQQLAEVDRLVEELVGPQGQAGHTIVERVASSEDDDGNPRELRLGRNRLPTP